MSRNARVLVVGIPIALVIILFAWFMSLPRSASAQAGDTQKILQEATSLGGAQYVPLNIPQSFATDLASSANKAFGITIDPKTFFSASDAIYAINPGSSPLHSVVIPLANSANAVLTAYDAKKSDGSYKIVGGTYDAVKRATLLVVYFHPITGTDQLEVVDTSGGSTTVPLVHRVFTGGTAATTASATTSAATNATMAATASATSTVTVASVAKIAPGDAGAIISASETCLTVGIDQICYTTTPQNSDAVQAVTSAADTLTRVYKLTVKFDTTNAVSELIGTTGRAACQTALNNGAFSFNGATLPTDCAANLAFTGIVGITDPTQLLTSANPIGVFSLLKDITITAATNADQTQIYDSNGAHLKTLPAGNYAVYLATPTFKLGELGLLQLKAADGTTVYYITCHRVEGWGFSQGAQQTQAAIKDGMTVPSSFP